MEEFNGTYDRLKERLDKDWLTYTFAQKVELARLMDRFNVENNFVDPLGSSNQ